MLDRGKGRMMDAYWTCQDKFMCVRYLLEWQGIRLEFGRFGDWFRPSPIHGRSVYQWLPCQTSDVIGKWEIGTPVAFLPDV